MKVGTAGHIELREEMPSGAVVGEQVAFEQKEYDVTDTCWQAICCVTCPLHWMPLMPGVLGTKTLVLEPEEAVLYVRCGVCNVTTRRPYGELGSVDAGNCLCFTGVASGLTKGQPLCPGAGCDKVFVGEIVGEMKRRMKQRGDTGQVQRAEVMLDQVRSLQEEVSGMRADLRLVMEHLNIKAPDSRAATMERP